MLRGSPSNGWPSVVSTSQKRRATRFSLGRHGRIANVDGSGMAIMSDSSMRANPSIEEPSKPTPSSSASASPSMVIAMLLSEPRMSVNQSRMNLTSCSRAVCITNSIDSASFIGLLLLPAPSQRWPNPRKDSRGSPGRAPSVRVAGPRPALSSGRSRRRSRGGTPTDAGAVGSGRSRRCACNRSRRR